MKKVVLGEMRSTRQLKKVVTNRGEKYVNKFFCSVVFQLRIGEISDVIETESGFHILQRVE